MLNCKVGKVYKDPKKLIKAIKQANEKLIEFSLPKVKHKREIVTTPSGSKVILFTKPVKKSI